MQIVKTVSSCVIMLMLALGCTQKANRAVGPRPAEPKGKPAILQEKGPSSEKPKAPPGKTPQAKASRSKTKAAPNKPGEAKAPVLEVVKAWDFTKLEQDKWEWSLPVPGGKGLKTKEGALYNTRRGGRGPILKDAHIKAEGVKAIRVCFDVRVRDKEQRTKVSLQTAPLLCWAGPEDVKRDEAWPFAKERRKAGTQPEKQAGVWEFNLVGHPVWRGQVSQLMFTVPVPKDLPKDEPPYGIMVKTIEFLG